MKRKLMNVGLGRPLEWYPWMEKHKLYIVSFASLLFSTVVALAALKEARLDTYLSLFTVSYFVTSAVFRPRRRVPDVVGFALFIAFSLIVAFKVAEILLW